jgi:hypothetical protein
MLLKWLGVVLVVVGIGLAVWGVECTRDVKFRFGGQTSTVVDYLLSGAILYTAGAMLLLKRRRRKRRTDTTY